MSLMTKIKTAVLNRQIAEPFTNADVKRWMKRHDIRKSDGTLYQESSVNSAPSNASIKNSHSSNKNAKFLECEFNAETNRQEYWLPESCWEEHKQLMKS